MGQERAHPILARIRTKGQTKDFFLIATLTLQDRIFYLFFLHFQQFHQYLGKIYHELCYLVKLD